MASTISASATVTTSSTSARMTSHGCAPGGRDLLAVGDRLRHLDRDAFARAQRARHVVAGLGLDAHDPRVRRKCLHGSGHAGDQPPAADRDHDHIEVIELLGQLEPDGALPGHHERIVVGVHEREPALGGERAGERVAVVGIAFEIDDLGAVALGGRALGRRGVAGHQDRGPRAVLARGERESLGVVARGDRAHAVGAQRRHGIAGAAELEGARPLEVLGLQRHRCADARVERARAQQRGAVRDAVDPRGRRVHVVDRDRQRRGRRHGATPACTRGTSGTACCQSPISQPFVRLSRRSMRRVPIVPVMRARWRPP
jgi:hypothetical protein